MNKRILVGIVILVVAVAVAAYVILNSKRPQFEIGSSNDVLGYESVYPETRYNYTVYVEIRHVFGWSPSFLDTDTITLYCEVTREDLTKITKQQTVTLSVGKSRIIQFFFSNDDLKGKIPTQYKVYGSF